MMRSVCASFLGVGFEACMRRFFDTPPSSAVQDKLCEEMRSRAAAPYSGEV